MSANTPTAISSYDRSIAESIDHLVDTVKSALDTADADSTAIDAVEDAGDRVSDRVDHVVEQQAETIDKQADRIDHLTDRVNDLEDQQADADKTIDDLSEQINQESDRRGSDIEGIHNRISELKQDIDDANPTPDAGETAIQKHDLTPIEQLSQADDVSDVTDSPSVERAVSLFNNIDQWGSKTPKGIVLKPADNPLSLLEADRDESLAWKQYYRAAEALEQLSEGSVTFFDSDKHGKMVVLHEQSDAYDRAVNGSLTPSSAGVTG